MPGAVFNRLLDVASAQEGFVTTDDARGLGVDPQRLVVMARRGTLERVSHGVYRMPAVPGGPFDQYREALLWPRGTRAVLSDETALDLHDVCDVSPDRVHVTVEAGHRVTREPPGFMVLHRRNLGEDDVTVVDGLAVVSVAQAILQAIESHLGAELVAQAVETARARGMLDQREQRLIARAIAARE